MLGVSPQRCCILNEPYYFIWLAGGKGNILHGPCFLLQGYHDPWILKEVERGTVSLANEHEMNARASHPHKQRHFVQTAIFNVIQWDFPCEDSESQDQRLRSEMDDKSPVIEHAEEEESENDHEYGSEGFKSGNSYAPHEQHEEENHKRCEQRACPSRGYFLLVYAILIHDLLLVMQVICAR